MPSADAEATDANVETEQVDEAEAEVVDEGRRALLEALTEELGDTLLSSHLEPGRDLWIRVTNESWGDVADYLRNRQRFRFFDWLSAIDWMPSPFGRSHEAEVDKELANPADRDDEPADDRGLTGTGADGVTGGETRLQVIARVYSLTTKLGLNVKADVGADGTIATWTHEFQGADWHEREAWEMYGIVFTGHPGLRNLYLPGDFEGHPLRKDFPLLARLVKPWPGIVDVEPMPEPDSEPESSATGGTPLASEASGGIVDVEPMPEPELPDGGAQDGGQ